MSYDHYSEHTRAGIEDRIAYCTRAIASGKLSSQDLVRMHLMRGVAWGAKREYDNAIADFSDAIRLDSKCAEAFFYRGRALSANTRILDPAFADLDEAIRLNSKYERAFYFRHILWKMKGDNSRASKDQDEAILIRRDRRRKVEDYNEIIDLEPWDWGALVNRGKARAKEGEYELAIADYDEAIRHRPENDNAFYNRSIAWYYKGEYDRAIADHVEGIRLYHLSHPGPGRIDCDLRIEIRTEEIRLDPQCASNFIIRGRMWHAKGEYVNAIADYNEAIRLRPQHAGDVYDRGNAWFAKGEWDRAISDYDEAFRLYSDHERIYYGRCLALQARGDAERARADFDEAMRIRQSRPQPKTLKEWCAMNLKSIGAVPLIEGEPKSM
jgi:tetratricopeptide (TPR) repeat protein